MIDTKGVDTRDLTKIGENLPEPYKDLLRKTNFGQSNYSNENFMVGEQLTPHRQLRQVLMQYDGICYTLLNCRNKQNQTVVEKKKLENKVAELKDALINRTTLPIRLNPSRPMTEFDIQSYELEIERLGLKIEEKVLGDTQSIKLVEDALSTKSNFEKILTKLIPKVEALEELGITFEEAEKDYWKKRFKEEAKLDIFIAKNNVPISKETLKAIFRLDKATKESTLEELGIENIQETLGIDYENESLQIPDVDKKLTN